jgi:hypothetical protein
MPETFTTGEIADWFKMVARSRLDDFGAEESTVDYVPPEDGASNFEIMDRNGNRFTVRVFAGPLEA